MFCMNCGCQLGDNDNFCPSCGVANAAAINANATADLRDDIGTVNPVNETLNSEMSGQTFKWGMLGLIFSGTVCLSLLGFIFSIIAKSKAKAYKRAFGTLEGRAKVGHILGEIGFWLGLGLMIYFAFFFVLGIFMDLSGMDTETTYLLY